MSKSRHRISFLMLGLIVFVFLILVLVTVLLVYPYNGFSVSVLNHDDTESAHIETDTGKEDNDGVPIVDTEFTYDVDACNAGYNVTAIKWLDRLGTFSTSISADTNLQSDELAASIKLNETIFIVQPDDLTEDGCAAGKVVVSINDDSLRGAYYRLRTVYTYSPNVLKTEEVVTTTQIFYLAKKEELL